MCGVCGVLDVCGDIGGRGLGVGVGVGGGVSVGGLWVIPQPTYPIPTPRQVRAAKRVGRFRRLIGAIGCTFLHYPAGLAQDGYRIL